MDNPSKERNLNTIDKLKFESGITVFVVQVLRNTTNMNKNRLYKFTYFRHYACCVIQETSLETPVIVFDIPEASCRRQIAERLNVSLHFPAANWLVLGDGAGQLYLIDTADRTHNDQWLVCVVVLLVLYSSHG